MGNDVMTKNWGVVGKGLLQDRLLLKRRMRGTQRAIPLLPPFFP